MYPLSLTALPGNWQRFCKRKTDPAYADASSRVFERDQYTCQFCSFQAKDYQEVVNLDHNYRNNKLSNLVTACCFCAQCFFLEIVGVEYGGGTLIYMPEVTQAEINSLCHVLFCAMANGTNYRVSAQSVYRSFKLRQKVVEDFFGQGMSDPATFGQLLLDMKEEKQQIDPDKLEGLRLLPSRAKFRREIERWAAAAMAELASNE